MVRSYKHGIFHERYFWDKNKMGEADGVVKTEFQHLEKREISKVEMSLN